MKTAARVLTLLLGAGPATALSLMAALAVLAGVEIVFLGNRSLGTSTGLLLIVWGAAGIYGTSSLWAIAFGHARLWVVAGLICGIVALWPFVGASVSYLGVRWLTPANPLSVLAISGPILVAVCWLGVLLARAIRRPTGFSDLSTNDLRTSRPSGSAQVDPSTSKTTREAS